MGRCSELQAHLALDKSFGVFSNPRVSLKGQVDAGSFGVAPFRDVFIYVSQLSRRWECGNRFYRFPRFVGRLENSIIVFRAFHKPSFPRSTSTAAGVHADFLICSNMVFLACCIRRAASVSLMVAATRLRALMVSPGRRNCCGRWSESSFSKGVCHCL